MTFLAQEQRVECDPGNISTSSQWYIVTSWFRRCPSWRLKMPGHWLQSHLWDYRSKPLPFFTNNSFLSSIELRSFSFPGHDQGHWVSALEIPLGAEILAGSAWHRQHKVAFSCLSLSQYWTNQCSGTKKKSHWCLFETKVITTCLAVKWTCVPSN